MKKLSVKEVVSECCGARMFVRGGGESTMYWCCGHCDKPCNPPETNECDCVYEWELICPKCGRKSPNLAEKYKHLISSETNEALKEFEKVFWGSGATLKEIDTLWKMLQPYLKSSIERARREERQRVVGLIEEMKNKEHCCESQEGSWCEYELALSDLQSKLESK